MKLDKLIQEIDRKRKLKGLNGVDLSKIGEVRQGVIGEWLLLKASPKMECGVIAINKICHFLSINPADFLDLNCIGGRLKLLSIQHKLTFEGLGRKCELSSSTLSQWERKTYTPSDKSVKKLADYCGVTPEWILHGDNQPKYGLIDLPVVEEKPESVIFTAKPKAQTGNFIKLDNGMIADISTGKTFTMEQFNQLFEVA